MNGSMLAAMQVVVSALSALLLIGFPVYVIGRELIRRRVERREREQRLRAARERILADGKVTGPKGKYVPHRPWKAGIGMATPRETSPERQPGYLGVQPQG